MIATRFRSVAWVAGVAIAALGCYLVSLRVAAERAQVAQLDHSLYQARQDIRDLGTELDTRSRLVQLERWNADVLALTAPKAGQYLAGEMQLASLATPPAPPAIPATDGAAPDAAALQPPPAVAKASYRRVEDQAETRPVHSVSLDLDDSADGQPLLHRTSLTPAQSDAPQRMALLVATGKPSRP